MSNIHSKHFIALLYKIYKQQHGQRKQQFKAKTVFYGCLIAMIHGQWVFIEAIFNFVTDFAICPMIAFQFRETTINNWSGSLNTDSGRMLEIWPSFQLPAQIGTNHKFPLIDILVIFLFVSEKYDSFVKLMTRKEKVQGIFQL